MKPLFSILKNGKGQALVEYALLSSLVGLVITGALMAFGPQIKAVGSNLMSELSGGATVQDGVVNIPGLSPSLTPTASSVPINFPTLTETPFPTDAPTPTDAPIPTVLACTAGSATNVRRLNTCISLRDFNNCENYSYKSQSRTCSWY